MNPLIQKFSWLVQRRRKEAELNEELQFHLQEDASELQEAGLPPENARMEAYRQLGNVTALQEDVRDVWIFRRWEQFLQDIFFGLRTLWKTRGVTAMALLALALGIGATTFMFAVVDAVLLRPLPFHDADRVMWLSGAHNRDPGMSFSWPDFNDYRTQNRAFVSTAAMQPRGLNLRDGSGLPQAVDSRLVTHEFFSTLGADIFKGRDFVARDDTPGSQPVCIISYGLWQRVFSGNAGILGRTISLDDRAFSVVGILPADFELFRSVPDIWVPYGLWGSEKELQDRQAHNGTYLVARLKPGVTIQQARADLDTVSERLQKQYPATNAGNSVNVGPLRDQVVGDVRPALYILFGGVVCLLLIACGNVANLLLALSRSRAREFAVRSALGASRGRLLRQLLTESVLLSFAGGAIGILLATWATAAASRLSSDTLPRAAGIHINGLVLAFTVAVCVLTGIIFGCAPAFQGASSDVNDALKQSSPASVGARHQRLQNAFVVSQIAMSLALLVAAGLLIRSFVHVLRVDLGFNPHGVVSAVIVVPENRYSQVRPTKAFFEQALRNIERIPGVTSAATITPLPLLGNEWDTGVKPEGMAKPSQGWPETDIHYISPEYLKTMHVSLLSGRNFSAADNEDSQQVVLVNREFVRHFWSARDPLGLTLRLGGRQLDAPPSEESSVRTVVGVVEDVHQYGLDQPVVPEVYIPTAQGLRDHPLVRRDLVVRSAVRDPLVLADEIRKAVAAADSGVPLRRFASMDQYLADSLALRRLTLVLLAVFAMVALVLAATGVAAMLSHWVNQRTREIGLRLALGATRNQVLHFVMTRSLRLGLAGIGFGLAVALGSSRLLSRFLFGVRPTDLLTLAIVVTLLVAVALLAAYLPARRASRTDPMRALRCE